MAKSFQTFFMGAAGSGVSKYWIGLVGGTASDVGTGIRQDSDGNIILSGYTESDGQGGTDNYRAKITPAGVFVWQNTLGDSNSNGTTSAHSLALDSSDNSFIIGGLGVGYVLTLSKSNSSGVSQWSKKINHEANPQDVYGVATDGSGNSYFVGYARINSGVDRLMLYKFNSSGSKVLQRGLDTNKYNYMYDLFVDNSGNIYIAGSFFETSPSGSLLIKLNSSGVVQWKNYLKTTGGSEFSAIAPMPNGNIAVTGKQNGSPRTVAVFNTSGSLQWIRTISTGGERSRGIAVDSSNNIYVAGARYSSNARGNVWKYNSSGTFQWLRELRATSGTADTDFRDIDIITVDGEEVIGILGQTSADGAGSNDLLMCMLPTDGSGLGTYGDLTYENLSTTAGTGDSTAGSISNYSVLNFAATVGDTGFTSATTNLGIEIFPI